MLLLSLPPLSNFYYMFFQKFSRPLLVLSIVESFSEISDQANVANDPHGYHLFENLNEDASSVQPYVDVR